MSLLATYRLDETADFILYLFERENEDELWRVWLAKDTGVTFAEFKKQNLPESDKREKQITKEQAETNVAFATQFIKQRKEGTNGSI